MKTVLASMVLLAVATGVLAQGAVMLLGDSAPEPPPGEDAAAGPDTAPALPAGAGDVRVVYPAPWRSVEGRAGVPPPPDTTALRAALDRRREDTRLVRTIPIGPADLRGTVRPATNAGTNPAMTAPATAPIPPRPPDEDVQVLAKEFDAPPVPTPRAPPSDRSDLLDLNTASVAQLDRLGAGKIGRAIVRGRPYGEPEDLVNKRVLRRSTFDRIRERVAVR